MPGIFTEQGPDAPFDPGSGLRKGKRVPKGRTGTRIRYWADRQIFLKDAKLSLDTLYQRARQTAFLVPGLTIVVRDERGLDGEGKTEETFRFDGGISEFCEYLAEDKAVNDVLRLSGSGTFKETVPVLDDRGHMTPTEVTRELGVDIALRWGTGYDTNLKLVREHHRHPQGRHPRHRLRALAHQDRQRGRCAPRRCSGSPRTTSSRTTPSRGSRRSSPSGWPSRSSRARPRRSSAPRPPTGSSPMWSPRSSRQFLTSTKRDAKAQARAVLDKIVAAARTRIAARQHKEAQRRKTALETSSLPAKLADCRSDDVERSELFIVEGDSALGTAKLARNSEFQALLPIRGKILNVQKASVSDMLKNAECAAIIQVIGAGSGRTFDIDAARYGKIVLHASTPTSTARTSASCC